MENRLIVNKNSSGRLGVISTATRKKEKYTQNHLGTLRVLPAPSVSDSERLRFILDFCVYIKKMPLFD